MKTIIHNVHIPCLAGMGYVVIDNERIEKVVQGAPQADVRAVLIDGHGHTLLPGAIDTHVHFREPGLTHKATIYSESRAAVAGGVTSYVDMPNTVPNTVTMRDVDSKMEIASRDSAANFGFYMGVTRDNLAMIPHMDYSRIAGLKLFMGSTTGGMLLHSDRDLSQLFETVPRDIVVTVHAEDDDVIARCKHDVVERFGPHPPVWTHTLMRPAEACVRATERVMAIADKYGARLNVAHVSTAQELKLFDAGPVEGKRMTCEVSPHHLLWCDEDYATRGARIKMNPSVKSAADREALRMAVTQGKVDIIATDHAPHLLSEKQGDALSAVSGAPMVQFSLRLMLDMFGVDTTARLMAHNPARLLGIDARGDIAPGMFADLVIVEASDAYEVTDRDVMSLCGWTPLHPDICLRHRVDLVMVNGRVADLGCDNVAWAKPLAYVR